LWNNKISEETFYILIEPPKKSYPDYYWGIVHKQVRDKKYE